MVQAAGSLAVEAVGGPFCRHTLPPATGERLGCVDHSSVPPSGWPRTSSVLVAAQGVGARRRKRSGRPGATP